jgi:hypothetical protein
MEIAPLSWMLESGFGPVKAQATVDQRVANSDYIPHQHLRIVLMKLMARV